jgi:hypothetical protein
MKFQMERDAFMSSFQRHRQYNKQEEKSDFLVQSLVDPIDWVPDEDRTICNVCIRSFSAFRRKHHCRMVSIVCVLLFYCFFFFFLVYRHL